MKAFAGVTQGPDAFGQLGRVVGEPAAPARWPAGWRLALPALDLAQHPSDVRARSRRGVESDVQRDQRAITGVEPIEQRDERAQRTGRVREARHEQRRRFSSADALQTAHEAVAHNPGHVHADPRTVGAGVGVQARRVVRESATVHIGSVRKYIA